MTSQPRVRMLFALLVALILALGVAACGGDDDDDGDGGDTSANLIEENADNNGVQITVGSKNFTEEFILGEIYAQALQAAGYKVEKDLNLGSEQIALRALKGGDVDGYPEYTSTALTSFFDVQPQDTPKVPEHADSNAQDNYEKGGLVPTPPPPLTSPTPDGLLK